MQTEIKGLPEHEYSWDFIQSTVYVDLGTWKNPRGPNSPRPQLCLLMAPEGHQLTFKGTIPLQEGRRSPWENVNPY